MFGICALSIVPMRADPSDKSEMVSQLLFGETYRVTESAEENTWVHIETTFDSYSGWIDTKQHLTISQEEEKSANTGPQTYTTTAFGTVKTENGNFPIPAGSRLPGFKAGVFQLAGQKMMYHDSTIRTPKSFNPSDCFAVAENFLKTPYLWGGKSPFGIDCSAFVQQVFKICGHRLPRDARQQALQGSKITFEEINSGDLAFFNNKQGDITHVGIITPEPDIIIHASGEVRIDKLDKKGILKISENNYTHFLHSVRCFS